MREGVQAPLSISGLSGRKIRALFPPGVHTVCTTEDPDLDLLYPAETEFIHRVASKRGREFAMGRLCARRALAHFGIRNFPLLVGKDRAPLWPTGIIGSLSHTRGICAVAVARRNEVAGIGLDLEAAEDLKQSLFRVVFTQNETAALKNLPDRKAGQLAKIMFSAKESVFKCIHPLTGCFLNFQDCEVELEEKSNTFSAKVTADALQPRWGGRTLSGRFEYGSDYIATGVTLMTGEV